MERARAMLALASVLVGRLLVEPGLPPPDVADEAVLFVKRQNAVVGCSGGDAGVDPGDSGVLDAPPTADAGVDAGVGDAGVDAGVDGGTCTTIPGDAVTMIVRPHITTSVGDTRFALFYVTPSRPVIETTTDVFGQLASLTAPTIQHERVEVEDPSLGKVCSDGCGGGDYGGGCGGYDDGDYWEPPGLGDSGLGDGGIVVETAGPYQFVRAQPADAGELAGWLDQLGYAYTQDDLDAVAPYIALGWHVVAVRVAIAMPTETDLVPIALTWPGTEVRVTAALGHATGVGSWPLTVYIAAEGRYELPNASIPYAMQTSFSTMGWVTKNQVQIDQNKPPSADPIAKRVADTAYHETKIVTDYVHVPVSVPCDRDGGCCRDCNARSTARIDWGILALTVAYVVGRKRRRPTRTPC